MEQALDEYHQASLELLRTISFYNSIKKKTISLDRFESKEAIEDFLGTHSKWYLHRLQSQSVCAKQKTRLVNLESVCFRSENKAISKNPETKLGYTFALDYFTYFVKDDLDVLFLSFL